MTARCYALVWLIASAATSLDGDSQPSQVPAAELIVHTKAADGSLLPQVFLSVGNPDKPGTPAQTCVSSSRGICSFRLARDVRFTLSARLAGFVPLTLGPEYPPESSKYELLVVMNVSPKPAFVRTG